jgi:hypothetical protein
MSWIGQFQTFSRTCSQTPQAPEMKPNASSQSKGSRWVADPTPSATEKTAGTP